MFCFVVGGLSLLHNCHYNCPSALPIRSYFSVSFFNASFHTSIHLSASSPLLSTPLLSSHLFSSTRRDAEDEATVEDGTEAQMDSEALAALSVRGRGDTSSVEAKLPRKIKMRRMATGT